MEVHAEFAVSRNHAAFNAGLIRTVRGGANLSQSQSAQQQTHTRTNKAPPNRNNNNVNNTTVNNTSNSSRGTPDGGIGRNVCRHMYNTGRCPAGDKCKFVHGIVKAGVSTPQPPPPGIRLGAKPVDSSRRKRNGRDDQSGDISLNDSSVVSESTTSSPHALSHAPILTSDLSLNAPASPTRSIDSASGRLLGGFVIIAVIFSVVFEI